MSKTADKAPDHTPTRAWCAERGHPFVTYNPHQGRSYCRCGARQQDGEQEMDWRAKHDVFHDHEPDAACRCYLTAA